MHNRFSPKDGANPRKEQTLESQYNLTATVLEALNTGRFGNEDAT